MQLSSIRIPTEHIDGLLLGVGQSRNHSWGRFPGNSAVSLQVPHGVSRCLEFPKNLGDQLGSLRLVRLASAHSDCTVKIRASASAPTGT
jgi:hypothetical protein